MPRPKTPLSRRFFPNVDSSGGPDACWPWTGSRLAAGYGKLTLDGYKQIGAHRVAFLLAYGHLPSIVMHECDNPSCCNPSHLFGGTQADNIRDMWEKGRGPRGYKRPKSTGSLNNLAKLNEEKVREIRASTLSQRALARKYDVSRRCITFVQQRKTWQHVD